MTRNHNLNGNPIIGSINYLNFVKFQNLCSLSLRRLIQNWLIDNKQTHTREYKVLDAYGFNCGPKRNLVYF